MPLKCPSALSEGGCYVCPASGVSQWTTVPGLSLASLPTFLLHPCQPDFLLVPWDHQANCCLGVFALAVPSAWKALLSSMSTAGSCLSFRSGLNLLSKAFPDWSDLTGPSWTLFWLNSWLRAHCNYHLPILWSFLPCPLPQLGHQYHKAACSLPHLMDGASVGDTGSSWVKVLEQRSRDPPSWVLGAILGSLIPVEWGCLHCQGGLQGFVWSFSRSCSSMHAPRGSGVDGGGGELSGQILWTSRFAWKSSLNWEELLELSLLSFQSAHHSVQQRSVCLFLPSGDKKEASLTHLLSWGSSGGKLGIMAHPPRSHWGDIPGTVLGALGWGALTLGS